jgi:hypothetical protein
MRGTTRRRALLLLAPLAAAAAVTVGAAPPASACSNVVCATSDQDAGVSAATSWVTISVQGGGYRSRSGPVRIPNRVPPPCWYSKISSGAQMAADYVDPHYYRLARGIGETHDSLFPPGAADHKDDDGNWWSWQCSSGNFDGSISEFLDYVERWAAEHTTIFVPAGQVPPQPPVPTEILMGLARQVMDDAVQMPAVNFNPAQRAFVRLETWMWFDPGAYEPVSVTASGTPARVSVSGVPAGSDLKTACAAGGRPYADGGSTDCSITFSRSSGTEPGQQWHFQVALAYDVTATAPLIGPPIITRAEDEALTVLESQAVAGAPGGG